MARHNKKQLRIILVMLVITWPISFASEKRIVVNPNDTGAVLDNPGMGWILHYYDNSPPHYGGGLEPSDTLDDFPGLAVIYFRLAWSHIEPQEGRFNWSVLDTPAQRWIDKGKKIALRFTCCESSVTIAVPEWVRQAGAKGYYFQPGKGVVDKSSYWEPDYDDPVFLRKFDSFLAAAAARYDGSPDVAFVDVGSFGVWGEGHTWSSTRIEYPAGTIHEHIDLHRKHFKKTLLTVNDDFARRRGHELIDYAAKHGMTLRDDSILVRGGEEAFFNADMAQAFWPNVPVILECAHYGYARDHETWKDGSKYLEAVEKYHASYASIHWWPREFLNENRDLINRINRRLGYRIQLVEASWPSEISGDPSLRFAAKWRNAGVAPCLPGGYPALTLKDAKGGVVAVLVEKDFHVRFLPVGSPSKAQARNQESIFKFPSASGLKPCIIKPGTYEVYISIGTRIGTPRIALPLPGDDGNCRYRLGTLKIVSDK